MRLGRLNNRQSNYIVISACSILILYMVFTPLLYNQSSEIITGKSIRSGSVSLYDMIRQDKAVSISYITEAVTENLMMTDVAINHIINRSQQESRQLSNLIYYPLILLLSGYGILVQNSRCAIHNSKQCTSILAQSLGGHAPPYLI